VLPQGFHFLDYEDAALVVPFKWDRSKTKLGNFSYQGMARLKPGVTMAQASADVARMLPIVNRSFPAPEGFSAELFEKAQIAPNLRPLKQDVVGDIGKVLWVLMGSIAMVLLIACANVANLLLVRVDGRRQELAIRAALGAGWRRIAMELMFESVVLGVLGSLLDWRWHTERCGYWWQWHRRVCRGFMRSELIYRCWFLRLRLLYFPACCLDLFRFSNTRVRI
jgi:hypothetical protein